MPSLGLPTQKGIIPPEGGWKANTLYLVEVAFKSNNPVHQSYFSVGFLSSNGEPGAYSQIWNNSYEEAESLHAVYYLKVLSELHARDRLST